MKSPAPHTRTLLAGWLLVLAYVCTLPSLLPAAFALVAKVEGSHGIELSAAGDETDVVLTHPGFAGKPHDVIHHHCLFARALAGFAESPRNNDPDHRVKFTGGANRCLEKRAIVPVVQLTADAVVPEFFVIAEIAIPRPSYVGEWPEGAPPRPPDGLLELKSTLLLV